MKTRIHAALLVIAVTAFAGQASAATTTSPSEVNFKLYQVWFGQKADCSDAVKVFEDDSPSYQDMSVGPTFGTPTVPNGTYQCVVFLMGDVINYKPIATTDGNGCVANQSYTADLFRSGNSSNGPTGASPASTTGTGDDASPVENKMWVYMTTNGGYVEHANGPYSVGTAIHLGAPLVVQGNRTGTLVTDFTGRVIDLISSGQSGGGRTCEVDVPVMTFR